VAPISLKHAGRNKSKDIEVKEWGRGETASTEQVSLSDGYIDFSVVHFRSPEIAAQKHSPSSFELGHFGF